MSEACRRVPTVWTHHDEWAVSNGFVCDLNRMISRKQIVEMSVGLYKWTGRSPYHHSFKNTRVGKLIDRYAPQPEMMIAPSHHMARLISECPRFTEIPVKQIYHGLSMLDEPNRLADRQTCRVHMNIPADRKVILMIAANLTDVHKGIGLGLQAIRRIRQSHDTHLILLGRNAESLKRDLDGVHVTTAYAANDAELAQAYRAADVTLIPSLGESLSFVALESLACQTPIVAFKVGGPAEIIGADERGLLAEPYDVDELANNLQHILHRSDLHAKLAQAGCQWVKDNCCMISFLSEIEQCYQTVIERLGH
jgi:glycosyltransferase involved in cell wall biosynthesis